MKLEEKYSAYAEEVSKLVADSQETPEGTALLMAVLTKAIACTIINVEVDKDKNVRETLIKATTNGIRTYVNLMEDYIKKQETFEA